LTSVLEAQTSLIERLADEMICSILLLSPDGKHLLKGAAPNLPDAYNDAIHGAPIGPHAGSCGTAAYAAKLVIVSDIATDPLWADYKDLALAHGLRACWSAPILSSEGAVLGTFAMYYEEPRVPEPHHHELIRHATSLCALAIERHNNEEQRRILEQQVLHAQKLESLGVLAGGIAHDFNNLLTSILGHANLARRHGALPAEARETLREIEAGALRAADLATQMLAYSGKGTFRVAPLSINAFVEDMLYLLRVSIAKNVVLETTFADDLPPIMANASQVRQVIMNLVTNASESFGEGSGVISVTTGVMHCDGDAMKTPDMVTWTPSEDAAGSGLYVFVEVSDTGCGMSEDMVKKIFDPFFTTKMTGRGLGLASTLGIMRSHGGGLKVVSEPGVGTTFKVLFPVAPQAAEREAQVRAGASSTEDAKLSGTVLFVDDEEAIRSLGRRMLEVLGLDVLVAADGEEAIALYEEHQATIDLVFLDLTMPRMDGRATFLELRRRNPQVRVVVCTGYSASFARERFEGRGLAGVLHKPYTLADMRDVLTPLLA